MKVICVNNKGGFDAQVPVPEIGSEYNVIRAIIFLYHGKPTIYYILAELGAKNAYASILFAPASGPDEVEILEERGRLAERMAECWKGIEKRITEPATL